MNILREIQELCDVNIIQNLAACEDALDTIPETIKQYRDSTPSPENPETLDELELWHTTTSHISKMWEYHKSWKDWKRGVEDILKEKLKDGIYDLHEYGVTITVSTYTDVECCDGFTFTDNDNKFRQTKLKGLKKKIIKRLIDGECSHVFSLKKSRYVRITRVGRNG